MARRHEPPGGMPDDLRARTVYVACICNPKPDEVNVYLDAADVPEGVDALPVEVLTRRDGPAVRPMARSVPFERVATRTELEELRRRVRTLEIIVTCLTAESGLMESMSNVDPMSKPHATESSQADGANPRGSKVKHEV